MNTESLSRIHAFQDAEHREADPVYDRGPDCASCRVELIDGEQDFCAPCQVVVDAEERAVA